MVDFLHFQPGLYIEQCLQAVPYLGEDIAIQKGKCRKLGRDPERGAGCKEGVAFRLEGYSAE